MIWVAIDPGQSNGFAMWDGIEKKFISLKTLTFWELISEIDRLMDIGREFKIRLEYPNNNRPTFNRNRFNTGTLDRKAQNVGSNKADAKRIKEYLDSKEIQYELVRPSKYTGSKMKAEQFRLLTKCDMKCSQHARDAGMLIYGR